MKIPIYAESIQLPVVEENTFNFTFESLLRDGLFTFQFRYFKNNWHIKVVTNSSEVRSAATFINVPFWMGHNDFSLLFSSSLKSIGQNDLDKVSMYMVYWK